MHGSADHRTATAMSLAVGFALADLLATRVAPPEPLHPQPLQPLDLFRHRAGGIP
jgi:hypothetical protein